MLELNKIHHGDCLEVMKDIPDESIDCIITDPPYGMVKGMRLENQKENPYKWDVIVDMKSLFEEYYRILKPKGKLFVFSQNKFTQQVRNLDSTWLKFLYPLIWKKDRFANYLSIKKAPVSHFEDISVFEKIYGAMPESRAYSEKVMKYIGVKADKVREDLGHMKCDHFLRYKSLQFANVSKEGYEDLTQFYQLEKMNGYLTHGQWLELYNSERERTRAKVAFNIPKGQSHFSNVLNFDKDTLSLHPTQKPLKLIERLMEVYTEKDAIILDSFLGSGTTAVAAHNTGRFFIGIEKEKEYVNIANKRIEENSHQLELV